MKTLVFGLLMLAISASSSSAIQTRKIQFRTLCIEHVDGLDQVIIPSGKKSDLNQEVPLYTDMSPVIQGVFESDVATFYTLKPGPEGKTERVEAGRATLGKSDRQMFLFSPGAGGEKDLPYQVMAFDDDEKSFPLGHIRAINLTTTSVRFTIPESTIASVLPSQSTQFPHSKKVNDYNLYPVTVEIQNAGGEWVVIQSTSWKSSDRRRDIVVILGDGKTKPNQVRLFSDFPPKSPP